MVAKPLASHLESDCPTPKSLFAYNFTSGKGYEYGYYAIVQSIVNRLWDDADLTRRLANMYAGTDFPSRSLTTATTIGANSTRDLDPRSSASDIDINRIMSVIRLNSFETTPLRTSDRHLRKRREEVDRRQSNRPMAVYELPSFFNHSCIPTAHSHVFGDVIVIRAGCAMKEGEEVTIGYFKENENDEDPVNGIKSQRVWGFLCSCKLCVAKRIDGPEVVEKCKALVEHVTSVGMPTLEHARSTLSQLEVIYRQPHWKDVPCKGNLSRAYFAMSLPTQGIQYHPTQRARTQAGMDYYIKSLEADGVYVSLAQGKGSDSGQLTKNQVDIKINTKAEPYDFEQHVFTMLAVRLVLLKFSTRLAPLFA